jgi:hypothetical protein
VKLAELARRHTSAAVLAGLAAVSSFYVLVIDRDSLTTQELEARKNRLLPAWRTDDVTRIEVQLSPPGSGPTSYTLERPPPDATQRMWNLTADGTKYPADEQIVDSMMFGFERSRVLREVSAASVDRAGFGLASPRARFSIKMGDLTFVVLIGGVASSQEGIYAEVEGRGVYVISKGDFEQMEAQPDELRSRKLVPYMSTELDALWLDGEGGARKFERAPWTGGRGSGFRFADGSEGPKGKRVDSSRLDQVLVSLGKMQAEKFLDKAAAEASSAPKVTITMVPKVGEHGVLEIGGACPSEPALIVVVRRAPGFLAACAPKGILAALSRPAAEFADDGMIGATVDAITELTIERGDRALDMARSGTGFNVRKPKETQIEAEVGNELLTDLIEARGDAAPEDAQMAEGLVTKMRVVSQGPIPEAGVHPERVEELEIGPEQEGRHLVIRKEDGAKLWIGSATYASLRPSDLLLRGTQILSRKSTDVTELVIQRGSSRQALKQADPELTLVEPKGDGLGVDRAIANRAMGALVNLQAVRWVSEDVLPAHGLDAPRFVIEAKLGESESAPAETVTLKLGALADDGVYATISKETGVFLVPRALEEAFERSVISREAFRFDPSSADALEVDLGTEKASLTRDGRQLRWKGRSDARAAELEKELIALDALIAVGAGAPEGDHGMDAPVLKITITPRKDPEDAELPKVVTLTVGAAGTYDGVPIRYARRSGVDATYAVSLPTVRRILELVGGK